MKRVGVISAILALFMASALMSCALVQPEQIKLGVILPLTGVHSAFGAAQKKGYEMAVEEVNGQDSGKKFVLLMEDDASDEQKSLAAARKLISQDQVSALMGAYSSASTAIAIQIANYNQVPMVIPAAAADSITQKGFEWIFRINPPSSIYARATTAYLSSLKGVRTVGILFESSIFGSTNAEHLVKFAADSGLDVIFCSSYDKENSKLISMLLSQLEKKKPDAIVMVSYLKDAVNIMRQCRNKRLDAKVYMGIGSGFSLPAFITEAGDASNLVFNVAEWSPYASSPQSAEFVRKFEQRYGEKPTFHSIEAYVAARVLTTASINAGTGQREAIRKSLSTLLVTTPYGIVKFENYGGYTNQNRFSMKNMVILQIQNGKYVVVWPEGLKNGDALFPASLKR